MALTCGGYASTSLNSASLQLQRSDPSGSPTDTTDEGHPIAAVVASMEDAPTAPIALDQADLGTQQQADLAPLQGSAADHPAPSYPSALRGEEREQADRNVRQLQEVHLLLCLRPCHDHDCC